MRHRGTYSTTGLPVSMAGSGKISSIVTPVRRRGEQLRDIERSKHFIAAGTPGRYVHGMADGLTCELCDTSSAGAPSGWAAAIRDAGLHQVWDWPLVRAVHAETRGRVLAGLLRDGDRRVGLVTARLTGVGRSPAIGMVDVDGVGTSALPGIALPGAVPAS